MKRNRTAELSKKQRILTSLEAENRRISVLLTEMETAASQVLLEQFEFTREQVDQFLDLLRLRYRAIRADMPIFSQDKRLGVLAQRFALAGIQILAEQHSFDGEKVDKWLKAMVEQGNKNRESRGERDDAPNS